MQFFRSRHRRFLAHSRARARRVIRSQFLIADSQSLHGLAAASSAACPNDDSGLTAASGFLRDHFRRRHRSRAAHGGDAGRSGLRQHLVGSTITATTRRTPADSWSRCKTPQARPRQGRRQERFGETVQSGGHGGTGIGLYHGSLYAEINDRIVRYALPAGSIVPQGAPATIVSGLPLSGDHPMHPFIIDAQGSLYVDVASATNSCQLKNRTLQSPGAEPCTELETRGGVWRYDANKSDQHFSSAERFATGIRNAEGFAIDAERPHVRHAARPRSAAFELAGSLQARAGSHAARRRSCCC